MITSIQNQKVKEWKKLHKRKNRNKANVFLVEGHHLVEEVLKSDFVVKELIVREGVEVEVPDGVERTDVSEQVFAEIAETETPQGVAAVVELKRADYQPGRLTLLVDSVQDPGNLGTMIRTADAAGFNHVILGKGTVDPYNDKVIRATQGSLFHLPVIQGDLAEYVDVLKAEGVDVWASTLTDASPYQDLEVPDKVALIVGNEGQGIEDAISDLADQRVYIPIYGQAESLNVAVASAVLMYHLRS
ncbi:RNA methyltransferase [Halobacillus litoralis]|uniref:TrmH family RNA methyltransferase n=1 Tax=Halobacillus litoralis TaxID=45668 RepID=UPI001CD3ABDA|nr:RNA methyltransferase [Halobacillus litoralis]MCA0969865.1 RNA methyltransferase [Halobacillus litoralis]